MKNSEEDYVNEALKTGPLYITLSGAEHFTENVKTHAGIPSDEAVEEMRRFSIENKQ